MITEMEEFQKFFKEHGVKQSTTSKYVNRGSKKPFDKSWYYITVGQTHFHFDNQGRFIFLVWDEMGIIDKREGNKKKCLPE